MTVDMDLSVVLVSYNTKDLLRNCLASIYMTTSLDFEVLVVDNASTDGSAEIVESGFPQAMLIKNSENHGFAAATNQALRRAKGRNILLLNSDTYVKSGAIERMTTYLDSHLEVGVLGCKILNPDGTLEVSCYKFPSPLRTFLENTGITKLFPDNPWVGDYRNWKHNSERSVDFVIGACLMVPKRVVREVGFLDERFFLYSEEADICLRIRRAGYEVKFIPDAEVIHYGGQSGKNDEQVQDHFLASIAKFFEKHYGKAGRVFLSSVLIVSHGIRLLLYTIRHLFSAKHKRLAQEKKGLSQKILTWHLRHFFDFG